MTLLWSQFWRTWEVCHNPLPATIQRETKPLEHKSCQKLILTDLTFFLSQGRSCFKKWHRKKSLFRPTRNYLQKFFHSITLKNLHLLLCSFLQHWLHCLQVQNQDSDMTFHNYYQCIISQMLFPLALVDARNHLLELSCPHLPAGRENKWSIDNEVGVSLLWIVQIIHCCNHCWDL